MFPKLSQKAWDVIRQITPKYDFSVNYFDSTMLTDIPDVINAFMSLFDLEKYPITENMVFEFLKKHPDYADNYFNKESTVDDWKFYVPMRFGHTVTSNMLIEEMLYQICEGLKTDKIIIIGAIHGWWE